MVGQIILGTPGSGKTSFCCLMKKIMYDQRGEDVTNIIYGTKKV